MIIVSCDAAKIVDDHCFCFLVAGTSCEHPNEFDAAPVLDVIGGFLLEGESRHRDPDNWAVL